MKKCVCKYCNEEILYKGRTPTHCKKMECIRKARNEAQRKWYANKIKKQLGNEKIKIIEKKEKPMVAYSSTEKAVKVNTQEYLDVIELAKELGSLRLKFQDTMEKYSKIQSQKDKKDEDFLHAIERLGEKEKITIDEIVELFLKQVDERGDRRIAKNKLDILRRVSQGINKNPGGLAMQEIEKRKKYKYTVRETGEIIRGGDLNETN